MSVDTLELGRDGGPSPRVDARRWKPSPRPIALTLSAPRTSSSRARRPGGAGIRTTATDALERAFARHLGGGHPVAGCAGRAPAHVPRLPPTGGLDRRRLAGAGGATARDRAGIGRPRLARDHRAGPERTCRSRLAEADGHIDRAIEIADAHQEPDAHALALSFKGSLQIARGDWQDGLALVDEAAAAASSGQLGVRWASDIYCNTIAACRDIGDYRSGRGSGPTRPSAGCGASPSAAIRGSAGSIGPS